MVENMGKTDDGNEELAILACFSILASVIRSVEQVEAS